MLTVRRLMRMGMGDLSEDAGVYDLCVYILHFGLYMSVACGRM